MLRRKAYDRLMEWKSRNNHKGLLVRGPRQVGKTYIIDRFARDNYAHYAYLDLSRNASARGIFSKDLDVDALTRAISLYTGQRLVPGESLIFLDEIQGCPRARESLKSFTLDGRYDVIACGSLIDAVRIEGDSSLIPVGYEQHMTMHSLDFEEFLWASGCTDDVISMIRGCIRDRTPIPEPFLDWANDRFRDFMIVGGMPSAVSAFVGSGQYSDASEALEEIMGSIRDDIREWNPGSGGIRTDACLDSIPAQLAETNKRFMCSRIEGRGSRNAARRYGDGILWIEKSGIGNPCHSLRQLRLPLRMYRDRGLFKVYMSDTGMLSHMLGRPALMAIFESDDGFDQGSIVENAVAECLMKSDHRPYYYKCAKGEGLMELDFVIELGRELVVIEVKSGKDREAPSIKKVGRFHQVDRRIILERSNVSVDPDGMEHYPLFAAAFVDEMEAPWDGPDLRCGSPPGRRWNRRPARMG